MPTRCTQHLPWKRVFKLSGHFQPEFNSNAFNFKLEPRTKEAPKEADGGSKKSNFKYTSKFTLQMHSFGTFYYYLFTSVNSNFCSVQFL